jgi:hypothetical protein
MGPWGCFSSSLAILLVSILVLIFVIAGVYFLTIREASNTTQGFFDGLFGIFDDNQDVTTISVGPIIQAIEQESWLETERTTNTFQVEASNEMPGILPGERTVEFDALVTITAGVDLELLGPQDILADGAIVTVNLPNAQIKDCILDPNSIVSDKECDIIGVGIGCGGLEDEVRVRAISAAIQEGNIETLRTKAFNEAAEQIQDLIENVNPAVEDVRINRRTDPIEIVALNGTCAPFAPSITPTAPPTIIVTP